MKNPICNTSCHGNQSYKILHVGDMAFVGCRLCKLLTQSGVNSHYINYYSRWLEDQDQPWVHFFKTSTDKPLNKTRLMIECQGYLPKFDIIHAHSIFSIPLLFSRKKKFVLHLHGTDIRVYAQQKNFLGYFLRKIIRSASKVLVSTPDLIDYLNVYRDDGVFLPNPIDFSLFKPGAKDLDLHDGVDYVIFHPTHHSITKSNDLLIQAFSDIVKDGYSVKLILIEWGSLLEDSKKLIDKLDLSKNIVWIQPVPLSMMPKYINSTDIVCDQYALHELGMTSLEAMACMKPIVTGYVDRGRRGAYRNSPPLPDITSVKDISNEIHNLLNDDRLRKTKGKLNYDWVRDEHSEEKIIERLLQVYREI